MKAESQMVLRKIVRASSIIEDLRAPSKENAIRAMVELLKTENGLSNEVAEEIYEKSIGRERDATTALGRGVALPHAKGCRVDKLMCVFARSREGIEFGSLDTEPVHILFFLASPRDRVDDHLAAMKSIAAKLDDEVLCRHIVNARDRDDLLELLLE